MILMTVSSTKRPQKYNFPKVKLLALIQMQQRFFVFFFSSTYDFLYEVAEATV